MNQIMNLIRWEVALIIQGESLLEEFVLLWFDDFFKVLYRLQDWNYLKVNFFVLD